MKKIVLFLIAFSLSWPLFGESVSTPTPEKIEKLNPKEEDTDPNARPQDFNRHEIFCSVIGSQATVYSPNSVCGEIEVVDAISGAKLHDVFTNLGSGYTFLIPTSHLMMIYVTVDNQSYYCEI